jgi:alpha(1,3/1,4) fucosyltransferase
VNNIKISFLWSENIKQSILFCLINSLSKKKIEIVPPANADLLILGPYDHSSFKRRCFNILNKRTKYLNEKFPNLDIYSLNRSYKPIRLFVSSENYVPIDFKYDFSITCSLGIVDDNHLRFPVWKDDIDWSYEGFYRENSSNSNRYGSLYNINDLIKPQGKNFMEKKKNFCLFSSHLREPRKSLFTQINKSFLVDGFGPYFNKNLLNHNNNKFKKKDIMKDYAFNLCPENSLYPGYYTEKIPDAFLGKCLPVSWVDQNVDVDFNKKAFINMLDYTKDNYATMCELLKDDIFLKKFIPEPLCFSKPNLDKEKKFINKIISIL